MSSMTALWREAGVVLLLLVFVSGCAPRWHEGEPLHQVIDEAGVFGDSPSVRGEMNGPYAVTDYGLKVYSVRDDKGRDLAFRSFQIFWMKAMRFEIEFVAPPKDAQAVSLDLAFISRSGRQRIRETLPIDWTPRDNYTTQLHRWEGEPEEPGAGPKSKKAL